MQKSLYLLIFWRLAMNDKPKLSASHIRYLLLIKKLSEAGRGVRGIELAKELGIKKPSAHAMLRTLTDLKLIDKKPQQAAYLTEYGIQTAEKYKRFYDAVLSVLTEYLSEDEIVPEAICSMIAGMTEESLLKLTLCVCR